MKPSLIAQTLPVLLANNIIPVLEGPPGGGKTDVCKQVADSLSLPIIVMHPPTMQPEDIAMPVVSADRQAVNFIVPDMFPVEGSEWPDAGILVADELAQSSNDLQKIWANIIRERNIHGNRIKDRWKFIATGNRTTDRAGANRLLSHLGDRVTTLPFETDHHDWMRWALDHDIHETVLAFINFRPGLLHDFDANAAKSPTPRGWSERVSPLIDAGLPKEAELECFTGAVGEGAAAEFAGFLDIYRKLPNPDAVLMDPLKADVPREPAVLYAIAGAISYRATPDNFERVVAYAKRLPPEFTVLTVRDAVRKDKMVMNTRAFMDWAAKEGADVLM